MTPEDKLKLACKYVDGFALFKLGVSLHPTHKLVLQSLFEKEGAKVSFCAANGVGKTSSVCSTAILFALDVLNAYIVSTSATFRQVTKQLVPNLKRYSHLYPNWEFLDNSIKINEETRYLGISTDEDSKFQGFHSTPDRPLLIIVDEAAGVKEQIYHSIGRCQPTYLLITGSPLGPEGTFYGIETKPDMHSLFTHYRLNQYECLQEQGYWLNRHDVENFEKMWGGKQHPLVLSSVYAEFAENIEGAIVTLSQIERCINNPPEPEYDSGRHCAIDFAAGGDANVIAFRRGNVITIEMKFTEKDTLKASRQIANRLNELKDDYGLRPSEVSGDADGLGIGMCHNLKDMGWSINHFHGGAAAERKEYKNNISECWLELARKIRDCSLVLPNDQQFKLELTSRKSFMNLTGKLQLESKEDMRARGVHSPDVADAIAMCSATSSPGAITNIFTGVKPVKKEVTPYNALQPAPNPMAGLTTNQFGRLFG